MTAMQAAAAQRLVYGLGDRQTGDWLRKLETDPHSRFGMNPIASELDSVLRSLDTETAMLLERTVRDALALAERRRASSQAVDAMGYPLGYFEATAGSFASESLEAPAELPLETRETW
jgi:hypothetical protein